MATTRMSSTSVAISQMPKLPVLPQTAELPVVAGGTNFSTTVKAIVDSVTKESIGLDKVENYAPSEMPVSGPVQVELDKKMDKGSKIPMADVEGLQQALDDKLGKNDQIEQSQVNGLENRLHAIETDPILSGRVSDFDPAVQAIIDAQPFAGQQVVQGIHQW